MNDFFHIIKFDFTFSSVLVSMARKIKLFEGTKKTSWWFDKHFLSSFKSEKMFIFNGFKIVANSLEGNQNFLDVIDDP